MICSSKKINIYKPPTKTYLGQVRPTQNPATVLSLITNVNSNLLAILHTQLKHRIYIFKDKYHPGEAI